MGRSGRQNGGRKVGVLSKFYQVNLQERDLQESLGVDGRTIIEWILKELGWFRPG